MIYNSHAGDGTHQMKNQLQKVTSTSKKVTQNNQSKSTEKYSSHKSSCSNVKERHASTHLGSRQESKTKGGSTKVKV